MQRRSFLKRAAVGATVGAVAAPALAQANPTVNWRLTSSFPKSLDTIFGTSEFFAKRVSALTGGKFNIRVFAPGEIVPALQVVDAVQAGTVEMGHTAGYYYFGKDPAFCFDTVIPFGLTARQQTTWMLQGGGMPLMREFFKDYGIVNFLGGNTNTQMGGWFRKEIKSVNDLKGLKMRIAGMAGRVMAKMGVVPQQVAGGEIYQSLEKGTIDAAEWVGPYDDEKLGINKVAPFYYAPGWWEPCAQLSFYVGTKAWESLPKEYQAAFECATVEAHTQMSSEYDARNPQALARLQKSGTKLRFFNKAIMDAAYKASMEVFDEESAKNPKFKKIYEPWKRFQADINTWYSVGEVPIQNYILSQKKK